MSSESGGGVEVEVEGVCILNPANPAALNLPACTGGEGDATDALCSSATQPGRLHRERTTSFGSRPFPSLSVENKRRSAQFVET